MSRPLYKVYLHMCEVKTTCTCIIDHNNEAHRYTHKYELPIEFLSIA